MKNGGKKKTNGTFSPALKQEFRNLGALIEDSNHKLDEILKLFKSSYYVPVLEKRVLK